MIRQLTKRLKSSFRRREPASGKWPVTAQSEFLDMESVLIVHGLHKSATMFLYRFFDEVCRQLEIPLYSIHKQEPLHDPASSASGPFVLCPVRSFETEPYRGVNFGKPKHLFQVRDPRDVLVSEYFSIGWRHTTESWSPEELARRELVQSLSIDQYVLREPEISLYPLLGRYQPLLQRISDKQEAAATTVVKYETMVTDFSKWLQPVLSTLEIDTSQTANESFFKFVNQRYQPEFVPDKSETGHRRNVKPGDHRQKLTSETIAKLNERFADVLMAFDYQR